MVIVVKLGGTSVGSGEAIRNAATIVTDIASKSGVIVVVSAMSGVSNGLVNMVETVPKSGEEIDEFISGLRDRHLRAISETVKAQREQIASKIESLLSGLKASLELFHSGDAETHEKYNILAYGEKLSAPILSGAINDITPSSYHFGDDHIICTDTDFKSATPLMAETESALRNMLLPEVEKGIIPVLTGFIGCTPDGRTTTLGRGSSDFVASIVGRAIDAEEIQIWTDVDGIMTAEPRIVPKARLIDTISYAEANELAYFGAKVLHPKTTAPAIQKNIPVRIKNSRNPQCPGTLIIGNVNREPGKPTAITHKKDIILIDIHSTAMFAAYGYLASIFEVFKKFSVSVDMISTTEVSVSMTIDSFYKGMLEPVVEELGKFARVRMMRDKALICVIGEGLKSSPGLTGTIFSCLGEHGININCISQGALEMNLSFVVNASEADRAVQLLHEKLFE